MFKINNSKLELQFENVLTNHLIMIECKYCINGTKHYELFRDPFYNALHMTMLLVIQQKLLKNGINVLPQPAQSPDHN